MTTLTLRNLWMAPIGDLSDTLQLEIVRDVSETVMSAAVVRRYAGGRDRIISRPGETRQVSINARAVDRDTYRELLARIGVPQLFRDSRGRRTYAVILQASATEWRVNANELGDVAITYTSITHPEVV